MRRFWFILAAVLSLGVELRGAACVAPRGCSASDDAFSLVAQALQAKLHLTYTACQDILWTGDGDGTDMTQIVVDIARAGRRSRMTYRFPLDSAGRVMLDDGVHAYLYDPAQSALLIGQSASEDQTAAAPETLALLRRNYACVCVRREPMNGAFCDVVAVRPHAGDGPYKVFWIDRRRHAILRTEEYDAQGCRRYVSSYETIQFVSRLPASALALPPASRKASVRRVAVQTLAPADASQAFAAAHLSGRLPAWSPPGYTLLRCAVVSPAGPGKAVLLHYGDGLKTLTVLEEPDTGAQPSQAELNQALSRYGQQAWVRDEGGLRTVVRGDLSLSPSLGAEMLTALGARAASALAHGLSSDFGAGAAGRAVRLRRQGWGYEQIGALCLWAKAHPRATARLHSLLVRSVSWPKLASALGADADAWETPARSWVAATVSAAGR